MEIIESNILTPNGTIVALMFIGGEIYKLVSNGPGQDPRLERLATEVYSETGKPWVNQADWTKTDWAKL